MKTHTISCGGYELTLRLTARSLVAYIKAHGIGGVPPLTDIMSAVDSLDKQITLFTAALRHAGNDNEVQDGAALIDLLADEGKGDAYRRELIVALATDVGLLDPDQAVVLGLAAKNGSDVLADNLANVLRRKGVEPGADDSAPQTAENPT